MNAVAVSVRDARAAPADRLWIQGVYRDYLDDLNPGTGLFPRLGEIGHREPDLIAHWFADANTYPLVIVRNAEPVGFARVLRGAGHRGQAAHRLPHGGVLHRPQAPAPGDRPDRGAADPQSRFAGRWEITEFLRNADAVSFWRRVVSAYTQGRYQERITNGEVHQVFVSGQPR